MFLRRDEPHADPDKYYRMQILGFDSSLCEWPTFVGAGVLGILFRMAEDRFVKPEDYCGDSRRFLHELRAMKTKTLWWGRERTPFVFQGARHTLGSLHRKWYYEPMARYRASGVSWSDEEEAVLQKYLFFIEAFESARTSLELTEMLAPFVDQAAKLYYLILPDMRRRGYSFESSPLMPLGDDERDGRHSDVWGRLKLFDTRYHDVRQNVGFYYKLVARGLIQRIAGDGEISHAIECPPSDTRAAGRDARVRMLLSRDEVSFLDISWAHLRYRLGSDKDSDLIIETNLDPWSPDPAAFRLERKKNGV